jgi:hypothetical protein
MALPEIESELSQSKTLVRKKFEGPRSCLKSASKKWLT